MISVFVQCGEGFCNISIKYFFYKKFGTCLGDILKSKQQTMRIFFFFFFFEKELEFKFDSTELWTSTLIRDQIIPRCIKFIIYPADPALTKLKH